MPNILEDLYYGNLSPCQRAIRPGSAVQKAMQKRDALESKLNESFTDAQKADFSQYLELSAEILDSCCLDNFITGFRLGARFAHEIFVGTDAPYADPLKPEIAYFTRILLRGTMVSQRRSFIMSLRFSRVTLYSAGKTTSFLVGGIPKNRADLQGWTAYDNYIPGVPRYTAVNARVETFLYGGEEPFDATPEEAAYFYKRIERQPDFIETRTEKTGESDFTIFNL